MNLRMQLIRAITVLAVIGGVAIAETTAPPVPACPFTKVRKAQQILLLDPIQKHPIWIDARVGPAAGGLPLGQAFAGDQQAQETATL